MKTTEMPISKALLDVWQAKRRVWEDTKDMNTAERIAYFRKASEDLARSLGKRWIKNPDGTSVLE